MTSDVHGDDSDAQRLHHPWSGPQGPRRRRIHKRLSQLGPVAAWWQDACLLLANPQVFTTEGHLIGHALRELDSALRAMLSTVECDSPKGRRKESIEQAADVLGLAADHPVVQAWKETKLDKFAHRSGLHINRTDEAFHRDVERYIDVLDQLSRRFEWHFQHWLDRLDHLRLQEPTDVHVAELMQRIPHTPVTLEHFFDGLDNPEWVIRKKAARLFTQPPAAVHDETTRRVHVWAWPQSAYLVRITPAQPDKVVELVEAWPVVDNPLALADIARIGSRLTGAPLLDVHVSDTARQPGPVRAKHAERVAAVLHQWIERLPTWTPATALHPVTAFAGDLADISLVDQAVDLTRGLLTVTPESDPSPWRSWRTFRHLQGRVSAHVYASAVRDVVAALDSRARLPTLRLFADLLEHAAALSPPQAPDGSTDGALAYTSNDASTGWRPVIGKDRSAWTYDVRDVLVEAVRDVAERDIRFGDDARGAARDVVDMLAGRHWAIFDRLVLHLLRDVDDIDLVGEWLCDRDRLDNDGLLREYTQLARDRFADLPDVQQRQILTWIDAGPTQPLRQNDTIDPGDTIHKRLQRWQGKRLQPIAAHLPAPWRGRYASLAKAVTWRDPQAVTRVQSYNVQQASPVAADQLQTMPIARVVALCATYQPPPAEELPPLPAKGTTIYEESRDGLAQALQAAVRAAPQRFAAEASAFAPLDPIFPNAVLRGLRNALTALTPAGDLDWDALLDLIDTLVSDPLDPPTEPTDDDAKDAGAAGDERSDASASTGTREAPAWVRVRRSVAALFDAAFGYPTDTLSDGRDERVRTLSTAQRTRIAAVLRVLTSDAHPAPDAADRMLAQVRGYRMDDLEILLHGDIPVRWQALEATIAFAWWLHRQGLTQPGAGLADAPQVQAVLDARLAPGVEPAAVIHGLFGWRFRHLVALDPEWATMQAAAIFGDDHGVDERQAHAWTVHAQSLPDDQFAHVQARLWEALQHRYAVTIDALTPDGSGVDPDATAHMVARRLGQLYRDGIIPMRGGLLERLFDRAPGDVRASALDAAGPTMQNADTFDDASPEDAATRQRQRALWQWRRDTATTRGRPGEDAQELCAFAQWFAAAAFDDTWALPELRTALHLAGDHADLPDWCREHALQRLADLTADPAHAVNATACVAALLEGSWNLKPEHSSERFNLARLIRHAVEHASGIPAISNTINRINGPITARFGADFLPDTQASLTRH